MIGLILAVAVKLMVLPAQIVESVLAKILGCGKTVTFTGGAEAGTDAVSVTAVELTIE